MNRLAIIDEEIEKTHVTKIRRYISKLKPKESTGYDEVSNFVIKKIYPDYISCLVNCFNTWLSEYRYPRCWKLAKTVTLNKKKSGIPCCEQTRPISLSATF